LNWKNRKIKRIWSYNSTSYTPGAVVIIPIAIVKIKIAIAGTDQSLQLEILRLESYMRPLTFCVLESHCPNSRIIQPQELIYILPKPDLERLLLILHGDPSRYPTGTYFKGAIHGDGFDEERHF